MIRSSLRMSTLLDRGARLSPDEEIVTASRTWRSRQTYSHTRRRACQLANALCSLGIKAGDRVATLMWNGHRHLEAYQAVPSMGAVLHALNIRLGPYELQYTVNHAEDRIILVDEDLLPLLIPLRGKMPSVQHIIVGRSNGRMQHPVPDATDWEDCLRGQPDDYDWPMVDEQAPFGLCYTSGTTGNPKGVMYTHRSTYLHTMAQAMTDTVGLSATDSVLQVVPMFHVLGWGYPLTATMLGAKQVMVHGSIEPAAMLDIMVDEKVTFSAGVPTIWQGVRAAIEAEPDRWDLSALQRINCGASAPPPSLIRWYWDRLGVEMIQSWGMTETNPLGVISRRLAKRKYVDLSIDDQIANVSKTGLPLPGLEIEIVNDDGGALPHDGKTAGNLLIRGPWVCSEYYRDPQPDKFRGDWLVTGDVAKIDPEQYLIISDRAKDLIKSGGEWISSIDVENHITGLPGVLQAAVVAQPHPKWDERPVALVVLARNAMLDARQVIAHCATRFAKWQLPDDVLFVDSLPLNSTGKIDKKAIRTQLKETGYRLPELREKKMSKHRSV